LAVPLGGSKATATEPEGHAVWAHALILKLELQAAAAGGTKTLLLPEHKQKVLSSSPHVAYPLLSPFG